MKDTWVISDTHFNHEAILRFNDYSGKPCRQFPNVEVMNSTMIDNWNSVVKPNDIVYHLGDVLFGHNKVEWMQENFVKLNGTKHLILGNHDNPKFLAPFFKSISLWKELPGLVLSHTPLHITTLQETHRWKDNLTNVHGHIHSNPSPEGPYKCVSVEQINYTPINVKEII
tara:strand:+ start:9020 stop:9529 length:510 start_codon:yes stop_codon:yes gene_type:complete